jgi:hypothetical protein
MSDIANRKCEHDSERECTACFKAQMADVWGALVGDDFEQAWRSETRRGTEDLVEMFEVFAQYLSL